MKFKFGDKVIIKREFYNGATGWVCEYNSLAVCDRRYCVQLDRYPSNAQAPWFWFKGDELEGIEEKNDG